MCYTGLFKRIIPFVLTFALGLFVASFFVSIAFPTASWKSERRFGKFQEMQRLRNENDELRERNRALRIENEELRRTAEAWDAQSDSIPPVDFEFHHPPPPPRKPGKPADVLQ